MLTVDLIRCSTSCHSSQCQWTMPACRPLDKLNRSVVVSRYHEICQPWGRSLTDWSRTSMTLSRGRFGARVVFWHSSSLGSSVGPDQGTVNVCFVEFGACLYVCAGCPENVTGAGPVKFLFCWCRVSPLTFVFSLWPHGHSASAFTDTACAQSYWMLFLQSACPRSCHI